MPYYAPIISPTGTSAKTLLRQQQRIIKAARALAAALQAAMPQDRDHIDPSNENRAYEARTQHLHHIAEAEITMKRAMWTEDRIQAQIEASQLSRSEMA